MIIRRALAQDFEQMWPIFQEVVMTGDSYVFAEDTPYDDTHAYWFGPGVRSFVAEEDRQVLGMYKLIANQRDRGAHVANASFMVRPGASGRGIGRELGWHCLREARKAGFLAMQFNCVVSTNTAALGLWRQLGFVIVGTLPKAFLHKQLGYVDTHILYRALEDL